MHPPKHPESLDHCGFTLIEVVIAMLLLSFAVVSMMNAFPPGIKQISMFEGKADATYAAQDLVEDIKIHRWDELVGDGSSSLGPDSGESSIDEFDDIDDFKGYSDNLGNCLRTVDVVYVANDSIDVVRSSPTDTKRISVTISNELAGSNLELVLFMTNH